MKEFNACVNRVFFSVFVKCQQLLALLFFACLPMITFAADEPSASAAPDPMSSIGRVAITLIGMIAFILLLAYWAKRLQNINSAGRGGLATNGQAIKTLATISLGLKEKVSLLQVGEQQLLVGITAHSIQTLLVLDESISEADIKQQAPAFQAILKKALNKK